MNEETFWSKSDPAEDLPPTNLALTVPKEVSALAVGAERFVLAADEFEVESETSFQVADEVQSRLKAEAKAINEKRLEFTRPIDAIKAKWMDFFKPAIDGRTKAAGIYQGKMSEYRRVQRERAEAAQREAERQLAEQRRKEEEAARKLREKAARLKSDDAKQRALAEAETREQAAQMMPTSVALSSAQPQTVASNVAEIHEVEKIEDMSAYLRWLADHPEWHCVLNFKVSEHNRLAKQFHTIGVPGLKFGKKDSFRTKAR